MKPDIATIFEGANTRSFPKGQILIYEGDSTKNLYYIKSGFVKVYNILNAGTERIIFLYGPGDAFPLTSYLTQANSARYFYEVLADVTVSILQSSELEQKIKNNIEVAETLVAYTTSMNLQFLERVDTLSVNDARRKIVALLAFLVVKTGSDQPLCRLTVHLTHQDFADLSGLTRETASIQLIRLRREGVLRGKRHFVVNVPKLDLLKTKLAVNL